MARLPGHVRIVEVGPRDGLQNEAVALPPGQRVALVRALIGAGVRDLEVGSFVSAKAVPQMADTEAVLAELSDESDARLTVLVPNMTGYEAALRAGAKDIALFVAASEGFSQRNTRCSVEEALGRAATIASAARRHGISMRGYVSCVVDCPYDGAVDPQRVAELSRKLIDIGCREVSLGETIGTGTPDRIETLIDTVARAVPVERIAAHFHQTWGQALVNVRVALEKGVAIIDSSAAGLGGCPFANGAAGNLATEDLLYMLDGMGIATGVDMAAVARAGWDMCAQLGRRPASQASLALMAREGRG